MNQSEVRSAGILPALRVKKSATPEVPPSVMMPRALKAGCKPALRFRVSGERAASREYCNPSKNAKHARTRGFSLLEVMIAIGIFFVAAFAILELVSNSLANARRLQRPQVDASPVLAMFASTNKLTPGIYTGDLSDMLGKEYQGYTWTADIEPFWETNNLFSVICEVQSKYGKSEVISRLSTYLYKPDSSSPPGPVDRSMGIRGRGR